MHLLFFYEILQHLNLIEVFDIFILIYFFISVVFNFFYSIQHLNYFFLIKLLISYAFNKNDIDLHFLRIFIIVLNL
jgi:hypothetical protein